MPITQFQLHVRKWKGGCGSDRCPPVARKVCLASGRVPCDVLFVGEAPGSGENDVGEPFVGPAGHLLRWMIGRVLKDLTDPDAGEGAPPPFTFAFTNVVGCMPPRREGPEKGKQEPDAEQVECCSPRLIEFVEIADPDLIVCVGETPKTWLTPGYKHSVRLHREIPRAYVFHPAWILRQNVANKGLQIQRCVVQLTNAVEEMLDARKRNRPAVRPV